MSDGFVALIFGVGVGGWLFFKLNSRTGDANASGNLVAGIITGVAAAFFVFTLLKYVLHY